MYNQRDARWSGQRLGTGSTTIGTHGCNITSLSYGLYQHGYDHNPKTLNKLFTENGSYVNSNLLQADVVASKNPSMFVAGRKEEWNDNNVKKYLLDKYNDYIVIGQVDAAGIGGSGQHFVLLLDLVLNSNGSIQNTLIGDPWGGLENLVTIRYAEYGCIKSLRVYQVKSKNGSNQQTSGSTDSDNSNISEGEKMYNKFLDVENFEAGKNKLIEHLGIKGDNCAWGEASGDGGGYLGSERRKVKQLEEENSDLSAQNKKDTEAMAKQVQVIGEMQTQINALDQTLVEKNKQIEKLEAKIGQNSTDMLKEQIDQLLSEVALKDETIKNLQAEVKYLKSQAPGENKPLWEQIVERLKELFK